ncbi:DUF2591 family protein [Herbaspirillum lusitanum]|uniref:DUF2591 family protein n=1 Tax=Herbaspirillum lusitanum TaxID=213312 RepID=A0ABW9A2G4_9BURK
MPTIYVNDLNGLHLDFWVAKAEDTDAVREGDACLINYTRSAAGTPVGERYSPTQDPDISVALIEKYQIEIFESNGRWVAELQGRDTPWGNGATQVEAALRAIVAARFGDTVEDAEIALPLQCFWLAFVAPGIEPEQFLGHAIIEARDMGAAIECARQMGMHPGSDVRVYAVNDSDADLIPSDLRNKLLSREEAARLGWGGD